MRRMLATAVLLVALGGFAFATLGAGGGSGSPSYWAEFDNGFGLIQGGDLKIAGVRAGKITALKLDTKTLHAMVQFSVTVNGWGSLRRDVRCESRPQSLIGEYFVDCQPGTSSQSLKPGSTIPVTQTFSTIAPDLVNDVLRQPYRERLRLIINELGAGLGGNGSHLNQALRRAVPALRETDQVLAILARQNHILADLATNGDKVISALAGNRRDVSRWVVSAKNAAQASAARRVALAAGFAKLPGFLAQLRPAMVALGDVATQQTPALRNLNASAGQLTALLRNLRAFSLASRPAFKALGKASVTGDKAVKAATPTVAQLNKFARGTPELGKNLAIVLEHLDNRAYAIQKDPRSPGGQGFTGLEALLNYVFYQSTSINLFDGSEHLLNTVNFVGNPKTCNQVADAAAIKANPSLMAQCGDYLGPTQPGLNAPDPTRTGAPTSVRANQSVPYVDFGSTVGGAATGAGSAGSGTGSNGSGPGLSLPKLTNILPGGGALPAVSSPGVRVPGSVRRGVTGTGGPAGPAGASSATQSHLLDYLMAP